MDQFSSKTGTSKMQYLPKDQTPFLHSSMKNYFRVFPSENEKTSNLNLDRY